MRASPIVIAATLAAIAARARADDLVTAQQRLDAGVAAYEAGDFARARTELLAARDLAPDKPNPYRWLALAEVRLGDCANAIASVEGFMARVPRDDPRLGELERLRDGCRSTGSVHVTSDPVGATVRVDGRDTAMTPARLALSVGSHVLVVTKPGFTAVTETTEVRGAGEVDASFTLSPVHRTRWWLWSAIGAGVVILATGAIYLGTRGGDTRVASIQCGTFGCGP